MDKSIPSQNALNKSISKDRVTVSQMPSSRPKSNPMKKIFSMPQGGMDMDDTMSAIPTMTGAKTWS